MPPDGPRAALGEYNCLLSFFGIILLKDMVQDEFRADQGSEKGAWCAVAKAKRPL